MIGYSGMSGYRALVLSHEKSRLCARLLADSAAEVICIEPPDVTASPYCQIAGTKNITLNIETERGTAIFRRLIKTADVLVECFPPGHLEKLGLGWDALGEINPRLIMASITDFGQTGPYANYTSCDLVDSALGGRMYVTGETDKSPLKMYGDQAYQTASLFCVVGIQLALWSRHETGKGQHINISVQECAAATLDHVLVRYFYQGIISRRQGSLHWNNAFRIFRCRDGFILISLFLNWETLVEWLNSEGMAEDLADQRYCNDVFRQQNAEHIIQVLELWTQTHSAAELEEQGQLMRFPWAKVASTSDLLNGPQLNERRFFAELTEPSTGKRFQAPAAPLKMSASPFPKNHSIPRHGEHNREIFCGELGISARELELLTQEGVI